MKTNTENGTTGVVVPPSFRERRCFVCRNKTCVPPIRVFLFPGESDIPPPRCREHGRMEREANKPYRP